MNQTVLRHRDMTNISIVYSNPRSVALPRRRPELRLVPTAPRPRPTLHWGNRLLAHALSALPLLFAAYLLLQSQNVAWDKVFGAELLGGVLLALLA